MQILVDELPKSCSECPCAHEDVAECKWCQAFSYGLLTYIPDTTYTKERLEDCPLKSLHEHDKELVEKVLEKVKKELDGDYNQYRINYILDQIQQEIEKNEN